MNKIITTTVAAAAVAVSVAGCGHHGSGKAAAEKAKVKASASALATNPAIVADQARARKEVTTCVDTVGVVHLALHPVTGGREVIACLKPHAVNKATFEAKAQALLQKNGLGHGALTADEIGLANLLVSK